MIILCVSSIVTAFSPNMECFILLRAIIAGSAAAVYTLSYSYCEYVFFLGIFGVYDIVI